MTNIITRITDNLQYGISTNKLTIPIVWLIAIFVATLLGGIIFQLLLQKINFKKRKINHSLMKMKIRYLNNQKVEVNQVNSKDLKTIEKQLFLYQPGDFAYGESLTDVGEINNAAVRLRSWDKTGHLTAEKIVTITHSSLYSHSDDTIIFNLTGINEGTNSSYHSLVKE